MVSNAFRLMENKTAEVQTLHDDLIQELSFKLKLDMPTVQRIIYQTCVSTGAQPVEAAHLINEFHIHLKAITDHEEEREDESK